MIIVRLDGGLGNQLFQYSLGRSLSLKNNTDLLLDINRFKTHHDHGGYRLGSFNINASIAREKDIKPYWVFNTHNLPFIWRLSRVFARNHIFEKNGHFEPQILQLSSNKYLEGCWQNEKYFKSISSTLRRELTLKNKPVGKNKALLREIQSTQAISLHVRRGDYVSNQATNSYHGTCTPEYYKTAVALIAKKVAKPHFYIFSDDPDWVAENMKLNFPTTIISHNGQAPEEDLRLMSQCQHFVIANSTFSWWGAWLSENSGKVVIAPKQWFADSRKDSLSIVPKGWLKI